MPRCQGSAPTRFELAALIAFLAVAVVGIVRAFRDLRQDDAFIAFQYARNLASGNGFVFNAGDRVLGVTSPLHVLLLSVAYYVVGDDLYRAALLIGAASVAAQALFLFLILRRHGRLLAWTTAAVTAFGTAGAFGFLTLETNLCAALVLGVAWSLDRGNQAAAGAMMGLAFLCRYDTALLGVIIAAMFWHQGGRLPAMFIGVAAMPVVPWVAWSTWYFGSFIPHTLQAKQHIVTPLQYFSIAAPHLLQSPWTGLPHVIQQALSAVTPVLWTFGAAFGHRHSRALSAWMIFGAALVIGYSLIGPHPAQTWHLFTATLIGAVLAIVGSVGVLSKEAPPMPELKTQEGLARVVAASIVLCALVSSVAFARSYRSDFYLGLRNDRYEEIAEWLIHNVRSDIRMASGEIGTIGYLTRLRMDDPFGLINETNEYPRDPNVVTFFKFVALSGSDVVLLNSAEEASYFEAGSSFRTVKMFENDPWSTILVRNPEVLHEPELFSVLRHDLPERARTTLPSLRQP